MVLVAAVIVVAAALRPVEPPAIDDPPVPGEQHGRCRLQQPPSLIAGSGVRSEPLPAGGAYGYRYTGLRLLIARGGRYYLLPVGSTPGLDATYVLQDVGGTRVELYAGTR